MHETFMARIGARIKEFQRKMKEVDAAVKRTAMGTDKQIGADISEFLRKAAQVSAKARALARDKVIIPIEARTNRFQSSMSRIANTIDALDTVAAKTFRGMGVMMSSTLVPIISTVIGLIGNLGVMLGTVSGAAFALATAFGAAGTAAMAFGLAAAPTIKGVFGDIETLTEAQLTARNAFEDLKSTWQGVVKELEQPVLEAFTKSMQAANKVLEATTPMFKSAADAVNSLVDSLSKSIDSKPMKEFFDYLNKTAGPMLETIGKAIGNFVQGFLSMVVAFGPLAEETAKGFLTMSEGFATWAAQLSESDKFQAFVSYISENMPKIKSIVGDAIVGIINIFAGFSGTASTMMTDLEGMMAKFREWSSSLASNDGFQQFLGYIAEVTPKVIDLVGNLITFMVNLGIALAPLGSTLLDIANGFIGWMNSMMQTHPIIGQITEQISLFGETFQNAFSTGNFEIVGQQFAMMMMNIVNTLLSGIPQLIEMGAQMIAGIAQGMANYLPAFVLTITQLLSDILITFVDNLPLFIQAGMSLILALIQGLTQALPQIITTVTTVILSLIQTFSTTITTYLPLLLEAGLQLLSSLVQGIIQALPQIITAAGTLVMTLLTTLQQNLPTIIQQGVQILISLVQGITQMLPQLVQIGLTIITTLVQILIENLPALIRAGIDLLNAVVEGLTDMIPELVPVAIDAVMTLFDTLMANLPQIIEAGIELLLAVIDGISQMLPELVSAAIEIILTLAGELIANLPQIIETGFEILVSLVEGLLKALPELTSAALDIAKDAGESFLDFDWGGIGSDIIKGIGSGLQDMGNWLMDEAKSLAKSVYEGAKSALGIHSPSKLFAQGVGRWIPAGIGVGIDKYSHTAINAVTSVATGMVSGMNAMQSKVNAASTKLAQAAMVEPQRASLAFDTSISDSDSRSIQHEFGAQMDDFELDDRQPAIINVNVGSKRIAREIVDDISRLQDKKVTNNAVYK